MLEQLLADAEALGYVLEIVPSLEETTDGVYRAASVTNHGYTIRARRVGKHVDRGWQQIHPGVDVLWQLAEWKRDEDQARAREEMARQAYDEKLAEDEARQRKILAEQRAKSEWDHIRESQEGT